MTARGPRSSGDRLRRLLVMLPWLMERGEVSVAAMAARFRLTPEQLVADLELASVCGLPPFVDEMIDVFVDDGTVFAGVPRVFTRPLRLTAPEGFAIVAAGRAALGLPGAEAGGALSRALDKLEVALGAGGLAVDMPRTAAVDDLAAAAAAGRVVRLRYWSAASDEVRDREVEPQGVFADRGHWYLQALDRTSNEVRTFRVDRVEHIAPTDETVQSGSPVLPPAWFADADATIATLRLGPAARWLAEKYPVRDQLERADGSLEVTLAVTSERWLARLLVRAGTDGEVLAPDEWRNLGANYARRVLAQYDLSSN